MSKIRILLADDERPTQGGLVGREVAGFEILERVGRGWPAKNRGRVWPAFLIKARTVSACAPTS